ncbi:hypothetical protein CYMTET_56182 [Cymbomonas tetramitiformis]|uniref:Uncharacterized protein n=1 Tax=Cymbomonas tetramitiformis TaxID=36881 RepID=A0AAE0BBF2_9CHLO|nr:hypothetical protein CYMTET_56182 [Cymbomonas tetramitiformis]
MENRVEINRPCLTPCQLPPSCRICEVVDHVTVSYFDKPPFSESCFGLCPGTFYKRKCHYFPPCCFNFVCGVPCDICDEYFSRPCFGEVIDYAPCDNCICRSLCCWTYMAYLDDADEFIRVLEKAVRQYRLQVRGARPMAALSTPPSMPVLNPLAAPHLLAPKEQLMSGSETSKQPTSPENNAEHITEPLMPILPKHQRNASM